MHHDGSLVLMHAGGRWGSSHPFQDMRAGEEEADEEE
jgi:hypothetical protein